MRVGQTTGPSEYRVGLDGGFAEFQMGGVLMVLMTYV